MGDIMNKAKKIKEEKEKAVEKVVPKKEESVDETLKELEELMSEDMDDGEDIHTDEFKGDETVTTEESGTPKKEDDFEKARKQNERNRKAKEYNNLIAGEQSRIAQQLDGTKFSDNQNKFQTACTAFFKFDGFLVESGPCPELGLSRKLLKDSNKRYIWKDGTSQDIKNAIEVQKSTKYKIYNHVKNQASLRYYYSRPKNNFGGVISMPTVLNIDITDFATDNFTAPNREEIKESPVVTFPVGYDTLFTYIRVFCNGKITEADYMKDAKFYGAKTQGYIEASIEIASRKNKVTAKSESYTRRKFSATNRTTLYVQENIIPMRVFDLETFSSMSQETLDALTERFKKLLSKQKEEDTLVYDTLDEVASKVIKAVVEDGEIKSISADFLTSKTPFGTGVLKDIKLRHWGNKTRQADASVEATVIPQLYIPRYTAKKAENSNNIVRKKVTNELGKSITLADLAVEYPAVECIMDLGVTETDILKVYGEHQSDVKRLRDAKGSKNRKSVRKVSNRLDDDAAGRLALQALNGTVDIDLGLMTSPEAIKQSIRTNAFK